VIVITNVPLLRYLPSIPLFFSRQTSTSSSHDSMIVRRRAVPPVSLTSSPIAHGETEIRSYRDPLCASRVFLLVAALSISNSDSASSFKPIFSLFVFSSNSYYIFNSSSCTSNPSWKLVSLSQSVIMAGLSRPIPLNTCPVSS
jgi:hypothetical protein